MVHGSGESCTGRESCRAVAGVDRVGAMKNYRRCRKRPGSTCINLSRPSGRRCRRLTGENNGHRSLAPDVGTRDTRLRHGDGYRCVCVLLSPVSFSEFVASAVSGVQLWHCRPRVFLPRKKKKIPTLSIPPR